MSKQAVQLHQKLEKKISQQSKSSRQKPDEQPSFDNLHLGNRTIQRLLAQRSGAATAELDDATADRINSARGGGQTLDTTIQQKMGEAMGSDFSGVRVHTSSESHQLNEQLGAKAFTTGNDVFFRNGEYNPNSSSGQELIAHELTHVVQQGSGAVPSSGKMAVNAPGDRFEQEADAMAQSITSGATAPAVQRQELPEDEEAPAVMGMWEAVQRQDEEMLEEEPAADMAELPEEEEAPAV